MEVTNLYKFIGFAAMEVTKSYKSIGFGAIDVWPVVPAKLAFIPFDIVHDPKPFLGGPIMANRGQ